MRKAEQPTETKQAQVPGTEPAGSKKLRKLHVEMACLKYQAKALVEQMRTKRDELMELFVAEGLTEHAVEIDVGDERRRVVTTLESTTKLKSKLDPLEPEAS